MNFIAYLPDLIFLIVTLAVGFCVASQKFIETIMYFSAFLLAGIAAIALHGPVGYWSEPTLGSFLVRGAERYIWILWYLVIYFFVTLLLIAIFSKSALQPWDFDGRIEAVGRRIFGFLSGYVVASTLLIAVQIIPLSRDFYGVFPPEPGLRTCLLMRMAPDYQLLTVAEYVCNPGDPVTGAPVYGEEWARRGPFFSNDIEHGEYCSFPLRYCVWRESVSGYFPRTDGSDRKFTGPGIHWALGGSKKTL